MSSFTTSWLDLRAPYDTKSRDRAGLTPLFAALSSPSPTILDLGAGSGANLRYLAPRLGRNDQTWILMDGDLRLLAAAPKATPPLVTRVTTYHQDLMDLVALPLAGVSAVVATALLDLVSAAWVDRLAFCLAEARLPLLATLTVDGRILFDPGDTDDALVVSIFNRQMTSDKGMGSALGAGAGDAALRAFRRCGFQTTSRQSDWLLTPEDRELRHQLLAIYHEVAVAACPQSREVIDSWADRRRRQDGWRLTVGHVDILAHPTAAIGE